MNKNQLVSMMIIIAPYPGINNYQEEKIMRIDKVKDPYPYKIIWANPYNGKEEVDETDTLQDAKYLVNEYSLAFGEGRVYYRKSLYMQVK